MKLKLIFPALLLAAAFNVSAMTCAIGGADAPPKFMVSVLLQKSAADLTVKLAHAIQEATTPEAATSLVLRQVAREYPGYVVVNTLATRTENGESQARCGVPRPRALAS